MSKPGWMGSTSITDAGDPPDDDDEYLRSLEGTPETCPACGSDDLHSASLGGEAAISCGSCVWIATIASFHVNPEEK